MDDPAAAKSTERINSEIHATCNNLGYYENNVYHKDPDCLNCLKDLIRFLRNDDPSHEVRRQLGDINVVLTDLLPIIKQFSDDDVLFDVVLRLLVNLTNPALVLYKEELPEEKKTRNYYLEIIASLQKYKLAFADSKVWTALSKKLQSLLERDWETQQEEDKTIVERILILLRNVLHIPSDSLAEKRTDDDVSIHDQVLWALHTSGMADVVIFLAGNNDDQQFCFHIIEIIAQMLREQTASQLATAGGARAQSEKDVDSEALLRTRAREQAAKLAQHSKLSTRHPRFGGTYCVRNVQSISERDVVIYKPIQDLQSLNFDTTKHRRKTPKNRRPMESLQINRRSTISIRSFLKEFCVEFLDSAYNTFMAELKDQLSRGRSQDNDETYYFWAVSFFMEFNRMYKFDVSRISETLSLPMFHYIHTQIEAYFENMAQDKKKISRWSRRIHLALKAYREIFMTLTKMDASLDNTLRESSNILKGNIFYTSEYRDMVHYLLIHYDPIKFPMDYLKDLIETTHVFVKLLEQLCGKQKHLVVQEKEKRRPTKKLKPSNKSKPAEPLTAEMLENKWDEQVDTLSSVLTGNETLPEMMPFDATAKESEDVQRATALSRIQNHLRENETAKAVALLRAAREVWPVGEVFGKGTMAADKELLLVKEIFFTELPSVVSPVEEANANRDDDEDSSESEEEPEARVYERVLNFFDFIKTFSSPKVVQPYASLLSNYEKNSDYTNHAILRMMHRIAWDCKMYGIFFQASVFRTFQKILNDPMNLVHSSTKEMSQFAIFIIGKFVITAKTNKKLFMEFLFWKTSQEVYQVQEGYDAYEDTTKRGKSIWSQDQDDEIKRLFEDYQNMDDPDIDVIDYLMKHMTDSSKTRRQLLFHLKSLDIVIRKKPAKVVRITKEWNEEEIEELKTLFQQYTDSTDILSRISENMTLKGRSKKSIADKLLELGVVSDRKELRRKGAKPSRDHVDDAARSTAVAIPRKKKSSNQKKPSRSDADDNNVDSPESDVLDSDQSESDNEPEVNFVQTLDVSVLKEWFQKVIDAGLKNGLSWISNALESAAEDAQDGEPESVPLVPIFEEHHLAVSNPDFQKLMQAIGLAAPANEQEYYWRIPYQLNVEQLMARVKVIERAVQGRLFDEGSKTDVIPRVDVIPSGDVTMETQNDINSENNNSQNKTKSETKKLPNVVSNNKKINPAIVVDSDSDSDDDLRLSIVIPNSPIKIKNKRKRVVVINSDDSEDESTTKKAVVNNTLSNINNSITIDSDSETDARPLLSNNEKVAQKATKRKKIIEIESDSEDDFSLENRLRTTPSVVGNSPPAEGEKAAVKPSQGDFDSAERSVAVNGDAEGSDDQPSVKRRCTKLILSDDDE